MSRFQRLLLVAIATLVLVVVAAVIAVSAIARDAAVETKREACRQQYDAPDEYFAQLMCINRADD